MRYASAELFKNPAPGLLACPYFYHIAPYSHSALVIALSEKKLVLFSTAILNGELMHDCFPKHSRIGTVKMNDRKAQPIQNTIIINIIWYYFIRYRKTAIKSTNSTNNTMDLKQSKNEKSSTLPRHYKNKRAIFCARCHVSLYWSTVNKITPAISPWSFFALHVKGFTQSCFILKLITSCYNNSRHSVTVQLHSRNWVQTHLEISAVLYLESLANINT